MSILYCVILNNMQKIVKLITILYTLYFMLYTPNKVVAAGEFRTAYTTIYNFDTLGVATITHTIELTNNLSHIYPTEYTIAISSSEIEDLGVKIGDRPNEFSQEKTDTVTTIHIPIKNANIGKDQTTTIKLSYRASNLAEKIGNTYTLTLPRTQKGNEATSFTRILNVPISFPPLKISSIPPQIENTQDGIRTYTFVGGGGESLTALFGKSVTYNLSLTYILKNASPTGGQTEIALPPDTPYQTVILKEIKPSPTEIVLDGDGNWLARYNISSLEKKLVTATLQVTVDPEPIYFDPSTSLPTTSETYWEQPSTLKNLANQLKTPRNIYQYLTSTYTYDYDAISRQKRLGAEQALKNPTSAICTEFTDTFVALSRSLDIPARSVIGYAYTSNPSLRPQGNTLDILHAYPEYYDSSQKKWLATDPTWGHTTGNQSYFDRLDFSHIAFVRWGNESNYPLPPGSYRETSEGRQIDVTISPEPPQSPTISFRIDEQDNETFVVNTGSIAIINQSLDIAGRSIYVPYVPPYGRFRVNNLGSKTLLSTISQQPLFILLFIIISALSLFVILRRGRKITH